MPDSKTLSMLGLCRRAGKLAMGHDTVVQSIVKGRARLVLFCSDTSPRLAKELEVLCEKHQKSLPFFVMKVTMEELHFALGYKAGVMSVDDKNFSGAVASLLRQEDMIYGS